MGSLLAHIGGYTILCNGWAALANVYYRRHHIDRAVSLVPFVGPAMITAAVLLGVGSVGPWLIPVAWLVDLGSWDALRGLWARRRASMGR